VRQPSAAHTRRGWSKTGQLGATMQGFRSLALLASRAVHPTERPQSELRELNRGKSE
jgi:hypothetical protein